jgi:hypothetical protein
MVLIRLIIILFLMYIPIVSEAQISGVFSGQQFSSPLSGDYESYTTGQDNHVTIYTSSVIICQTFTPSSAHRIDYVYIYALKGGSPGNIKIDIYDTDNSIPKKPTGSILATSGNVSANGFDTSFGWQKISLISGYNLSASTTYAIVASGGTDQYNYVEWGDDGTSPTYSGGTYGYSNNTGSTWNMSLGDDLLFKEGQN